MIRKAAIVVLTVAAVRVNLWHANNDPQVYSDNLVISPWSTLFVCAGIVALASASGKRRTLRAMALQAVFALLAVSALEVFALGMATGAGSRHNQPAIEIVRGDTSRLPAGSTVDIQVRNGKLEAAYMYCGSYETAVANWWGVSFAGFEADMWSFLQLATDPPPPQGETPLMHSIAAPFLLPSLLLSAYPTIAFYRGPLRRYRRRRRGLCLTCEYDLTGNESGVCPECATEVERV